MRLQPTAQRSGPWQAGLPSLDGLFRTPADRDEALAQRTKDLAGLMGQVRGFDLDAYLSGWDQTRYAEPWALASDGLPGQAAVGVSLAAPPGDLYALAQKAGMARKLKVLHLTDYSAWHLKETASARLSMELRKFLPHMEVDYAMAAGPY